MQEEVELEDDSCENDVTLQTLTEPRVDPKSQEIINDEIVPVVYKLGDFPELKNKIDRAVSNVELYGSDRYDYIKIVILKYEKKFLKRVNNIERDPTNGRLSVNNDSDVVKLKERYSHKVHILQEALN